jgi:fido (protein-threonine AMPylation protein)
MTDDYGKRISDNAFANAEHKEIERGLKALAALRKIHRYLYPEIYPAKQVADHPNYSTGDDYYEWNADTIVIVADMVDTALANDPTTPKHA